MSKKKDKELEKEQQDCPVPDTEPAEPVTPPEQSVEQPPDPSDELNKLKDQHLRLMAEFDNYRKRTVKERESLYAVARADTVEKFLSVYDNLERAIKQPTQDEAYKKGVEMIMAQFVAVFEKLGVTEIPSDGGFDPAKHNAVMHAEDENFGENQIAEVFQKGFELDGKVIRHAVVKVVN